MYKTRITVTSKSYCAAAASTSVRTHARTCIHKYIHMYVRAEYGMRNVANVRVMVPKLCAALRPCQTYRSL